MLINEVAKSAPNPTVTTLFRLAVLMRSRAEDTGIKPETTVGDFLSRARDLNVDMQPSELQTLVSQPPLNAVILPLNPDDKVLKFKTDTPEESVSMPVNQAQEIVARAAKSAMKRNQS
jgi:hypothetical protein